MGPVLVQSEVEDDRAVDVGGRLRVGEQHPLVLAVDRDLVALKVEGEPVHDALGRPRVGDAERLQLLAERVEPAAGPVLEPTERLGDGPGLDALTEVDDPVERRLVGLVEPLLVVFDVDRGAEPREERAYLADARVGAGVRGAEELHERAVVGVVGEPGPAVERDVDGFERRLDERGELAPPIEHDGDVVRVGLADGVSDGVDDRRRRVEDVERRPVELPVAEQVDPVVLVGEDRSLQSRQLGFADDGDVVRVVDAVVGESTRRRVEGGDVLDRLPRGVVDVRVVVEDRVEAAAVFPALEDVPGGVGGALPVEVGLVDEFEEGDPVLGLLAAPRRESAGRDRERAEPRPVDAAVQRARQRRVRNHDEVVSGDRLVEVVDRPGAGK